MNLRVAMTILVAAGMSSPCVGDPKANSDWLIGSWILCEDPDHGPKESLQFNSDGTGVLIRTKGNNEFVHKHTGEHVFLLFHVRGRDIPIQYAVTSDHQRLLLYSDRTRHTSYYVRTDGKLVAGCTVQ
jgi:hypothetical protein